MMAQRYQGPDGTIYEELPGGGYAIVSSGQQPQPYTIGQVDPAAQYQGPKAAADLQAAQIRAAEAARNAPLDTALKTAQLDNLRTPRSAPPSGYRYNAAGNLEKIPGGPADKKPGGSGALDALVNQINETERLFKVGPGATSGAAGLADFLPGQLRDVNGQFDVAANQLEDQAAMAFKVPGAGAQTDADAARIARAIKPNRFSSDSSNEQVFKGLKARVDAMRASQGLPAAQWANGTTSNSPADAKRQNDPRAATIGNAAPPSGGNPQGPRGYDVGGVAGGVGAPKPGGSGGFSNAAGLEMAQRLSKAYTAGADVSALNKILRENGYQEFTDPQSIAAIQKRGPLNFAPPQVDDARSGLGRAIGDNLNNGVGAYAVGAADALTAGNLDTLGGGQTKLAQQYLEKNNPTASLLGTVTGGALAAGGAELGLARAGLTAGRAALAGDALYGGAYGAGSADGGNRLLGALAGATGGAVGGIAGRGVASGVGRLARGVQNADVSALRQAGIPTTVGQTLGGTAKGIEDRLSGLPVVGDMVNARRLEGMQAFNRAGFDEALAPINANTGGIIGEQGIDAAQGATSQGYRQALDNVNVAPDPQFTGDYSAAVAQGAQVPRVGPEFQAWAQADLDPLVAQPSFNGATVQDFLQQTRGASFGTDQMGKLVGRSVTGAEDAMRGLVQRQSPGTIPALAKADQAYRQVQVLRDAVNRARNGTRTGETGIFAPSQLADAAAANAKKFGNSQGTTRQPFFDLTRAAQSVLPNSVPDSGTAGRAVVAGGLGLAGLGGGAGYAAGDTSTGAGTGLALAALLAAGGTKTGQKALVKALADRPDALVKFGNKVIRGSKYGGIFGAPLVAPIATGIVAQ